MRTQGKPMNISEPQHVEPGEDNTAAALAHLQGAGGMTRTQTSHQVAVHVNKPRALADVQTRVIQEASYAKGGFYYAWTVKDKNSPTGESLIEGVSIEGAMILVRNWGNAVCEPTLEADMETPTHWIFKATFIDLETGFSASRLFRQRKGQTSARYENERAQDIAFQIGQSKAVRNVITRAVPSWLLEAGMDAAKRAEADKYANVREAITALVKFAGGLGITESQLQRKMAKRFADWVPSDVAVMRGVFRGVKDGLSTLSDEFSPDEAEVVEPEPAATETPATGPDATAPAQDAPALEKATTESAKPADAPSKPAPEEADSEPPEDVPTVGSEPAPEPTPAAEERQPGDDTDDIPFGQPAAPPTASEAKGETVAPKAKEKATEPVFTPPTRARK